MESCKDLITARSFMMNTYPLQNAFKNQQEILLFFEMQSLFQISLENMTALMERNPIETFITEFSQVVCPTEDFSSRKDEINCLRHGLNKHLSGLKAELSSEKYVKKVMEEVSADLAKIVNKRVIGIKECPEKDENWTCVFCLRGGVKGSPHCEFCRRNTYSDSNGCWSCTYCGCPMPRSREECSNGYCHKGKRPQESKGFWSCSLCGYANCNNLSSKCSACNQKGK
jgi:hypothetical protein